MENEDYTYSKSTGWAFLVFGIAITVANVVAYLQFVLQ